MSPEDIGKLLGGYATGTLTAEERQALFTAALEDQELFDALAREQALRDLLRDPAARAELLSALDPPANRQGGFWEWLRRPLVAGLAAAAVATIAIVGVWQGTRVAGVKPAQPVIVADLKRREPEPPRSPAQPAPPAREIHSRTPAEVAEAPAAAFADKKAAPLVVTSPAKVRSRLADAPADANAPAPPPASAAPAPLPAAIPRKAETESTALGNLAGAAPGGVTQNVTLDARALFYAGESAPGASTLLQRGKDAAPAMAKTVSGQAAPATAAPPRLGVRVSILRGENEVDLTTVLDPGETVRLRLIPNAGGFLYVTEGTRTVAAGAAPRLKPFETPELRFDGSGQKQLYITLSRTPQTAAPLSPGALARSNMVESSADQGRATYVVSGPSEAGEQQVTVPVTLTYR